MSKPNKNQKMFKINTKYKPISDQENAVLKLAQNLENGNKYQTLLGVTGSGKTFTMANLIQKVQKPTLIISHNKTLAGQLYQEMRELFPNNAVCYFVSYYDYYQPEAYIPSTDTYIEKDSDINDLIDQLRLATTANLLTRNDVIVIASVSCIYNIGSPKEYANFVFEIKNDLKISREELIDKIVTLQYERSDFGFNRGTFRVRGDTIDIYPAYQNEAIRVEMGTSSIKNVEIINPVSGEKIESKENSHILYPAKHFMTDPTNYKSVFESIKEETRKQVRQVTKEGKLLEANRIAQKVN